MYLSIVIPVFNEEKNISLLIEKIELTVKKLTNSYEIIFVDDGSSDSTFLELRKHADRDVSIKIIKFTRNFGQTAALNAGFRYAQGEYVVTLDGDLQNNPADIPRLLLKLEEGYDVVCGWRYKRKDPGFNKVFPSLIASFIRRRILGDTVHDSGCSLKAYRKKVLKNLNLVGEAHRFIPLILQWDGYRIGELKVTHYPRKYGQTKYGVKRLWHGLFDMIGLVFWERYRTKPLHLFGAIGFFSILSAFLLLFVIFMITISKGIQLLVGPLLLFSVVLFLGGLHIFLIGVIAEMQTKLYYSHKENYEIEMKVN